VGGDGAGFDRCLASLGRLDPQPEEIIVVIDGIGAAFTDAESSSPSGRSSGTGSTSWSAALVLSSVGSATWLGLITGCPSRAIDNHPARNDPTTLIERDRNVTVATKKEGNHSMIAAPIKKDLPGSTSTGELARKISTLGQRRTR